MRHGLAIVLLVVAVAGAVARPWRLPAWVAPVGGGRASRSRPETSRVHDGAASRCARSAAPLAFVALAVPLAVMLDRGRDLRGARRAAPRAARGSSARAGCSRPAVVALLNLDAAVVLLTPLYVRTARQRRSRPGDARVPAGAARDARERRAAGLESHEPDRRVASRRSRAPTSSTHLALPSVVGVDRRAGSRTGGSFRARAVDRRPSRVPPTGARWWSVGARSRCSSCCWSAVSTSGVPAWVAALVTIAFLAVFTRHVAVAAGAGRHGRARRRARGRRGRCRPPPSRTSLASAGDGGVRGFGTGVVSADVLNNLPATLVTLPHVAHTATRLAVAVRAERGPEPRDHRLARGAVVAGVGACVGCARDRRPVLASRRARRRARHGASGCSVLVCVWKTWRAPMSTTVASVRQCERARRGRLLRSPRSREPIAQDEARRDPPDRRRAASPFPGLGRRGRPPEPVAARRDRRRGGRQQRHAGARGARFGRALRRRRARRRADRRRDRMVGATVSPQRKYPRTARVNEVMLEVLADELERMSDPRLELVTLTGVEGHPRPRLRDRVLLDARRHHRRRARVVRPRTPATRCAPRRRICGASSAARCGSARCRSSRSSPTPASSPASASRRSCAASTTMPSLRTRLMRRATRRSRERERRPGSRRRARASGAGDRGAPRASRSCATSTPTATRSARRSRSTTCCAPPASIPSRRSRRRSSSRRTTAISPVSIC